MSEPTLNDVYLQLGRLTAGVEGLTDKLSEAKEDREWLAEKVDTVSDRTARLEEIVKKVEPTVDQLASLKTKAIGGIAVLVFVGGIVGWLAGIWITEVKLWIIRIITGH